MIVIQTFPSYEQAHMALSFLEDAGIDAYIWDENTAGLYPLFNPSLGMVRLAVDESTAETAAEVLKDWLG